MCSAMSIRPPAYSTVLLLGNGGEGVGCLLLLALGTRYCFEFFLAACFGGGVLVVEAVGFACFVSYRGLHMRVAPLIVN